MCRIEIIRLEQAQLLAPQRGIMGQRQHQPVAQRFTGGNLEHGRHCASIGIHGNDETLGTNPRRPPDPSPARYPRPAGLRSRTRSSARKS